MNDHACRKNFVLNLQLHTTNAILRLLAHLRLCGCHQCFSTIVVRNIHKFMEKQNRRITTTTSSETEREREKKTKHYAQQPLLSTHNFCFYSYFVVFFENCYTKCRIIYNISISSVHWQNHICTINCVRLQFFAA